MKSRLLLLVVLAFFSCEKEKAFYVSTVGDNMNPGTIARLFPLDKADPR